jgi:transposase-like protein
MAGVLDGEMFFNWSMMVSMMDGFGNSKRSFSLSKGFLALHNKVCVAVREMKCPRYGSEHIGKNGIQKGKQNPICAKCGRQFINPSEQTKAFPKTTKQTCPEVVSQWHGIQGYRKSDGVHHSH